MSVIRIRFVANSSFISRGIRAVTGSLWSHVESWDFRKQMWISAYSQGIALMPWNYANESRIALYEIPCTEEEFNVFHDAAEADLGVKYNWLDIAGLLIQDRSLTSAHRLMCAQANTKWLLKTFGAARVLNCAFGWEYRITPEILHLSPIFVGHLKRQLN